ncbi:MAG TPA: LacI family DNA-binding transcriptional regulator [Chthoniobacteraceae bacterium]|nr:LacI family DNA-binding transcriptional regulator [Chthoniobacteraceae bacterium]
MKDIAAHVGLSTSTVSLALRDHRSISLETKRRVWEAQERLGYRAPLQAPTSAAPKRSKNQKPLRDIVFLLVNRQFENSSYGPEFQKIADLAAERGWRSSYLSASLDDLHEGRIPPLLKNHRADGIIVSGAYDARAHQQVRKLGIPVVVLGRYQLGPEPWMACEPDFAHGIELFLDRMSALGHTRFGVVFKDPHSPYTRNILRELEAREVSWCEAALQTKEPEKGAPLIEALLDRKPTAIFLVTESLAPLTYEVCARRGLVIPRDISIVNFDGTGRYIMQPSLARISSAKGMQASLIDKLERLMDDPDTVPTRELFPKRFVPGNSIGPCPPTAT